MFSYFTYSITNDPEMDGQYKHDQPLKYLEFGKAVMLKKHCCNFF